LLRIAAAEAKAYGPEGEVEGDGCQDEGLCDAAAVDARVRRRLQSSDQLEAAHVHAGRMDHGHRHGSHLHLPVLASPGKKQLMIETKYRRFLTVTHLTGLLITKI
jgi:hypothetical protein